MKDTIFLQCSHYLFMINMFVNVTNRTSTAIEDLQVDALSKQAIVTFSGGDTYAYGNVSTRAILNVLFNPDVSLGFWVNNNLVQSDRVTELNGDEFDYQTAVLNAKREELAKTIKLPEFA